MYIVQYAIVIDEVFFYWFHKHYIKQNLDTYFYFILLTDNILTFIYLHF